MSILSQPKPIATPISDKDTVIATDILQRLALAALVHQNGGRIVFPLKDLDWIKDNTLGLNSEIISSQHTNEKWFVVNVVSEPNGSTIIQ